MPATRIPLGFKASDAGDDSEPDAACAEVAQLSRELDVLAGETVRRGDVALVYDYEAAWVIDIQPQSKEFVYAAEVFRFYRAVRQRGLNGFRSALTVRNL